MRVYSLLHATVVVVVVVVVVVLIYDPFPPMANVVSMA